MMRLHLWQWDGKQFYFARGGIPENGTEALAMGYLLAVIAETGEEGISHSDLERAWLWMEKPDFFGAWACPQAAKQFTSLVSRMWAMGNGDLVSSQSQFCSSLEQMGLVERVVDVHEKTWWRRTSVPCEPWLPNGETFSALAALVVPVLARAEGRVLRLPP